MSDQSTMSAPAGLADLFRHALDLSADVDVTGLAYGQHDHWDSIGHMVLVAEIEDAYGLMLDTDDVIGLSDFDAAVRLLQRNGVAV